MKTSAVRPPTWLRWLAVAVAAGGIFFASVLDPPSSGVPPVGPLGLLGFDKWLHALAYAGLAGALATALAPSHGPAASRSPAVTAALAGLLAVGYGVGIEFVQAPLPERSFSVLDMAANATGAVVAVLGWRLLVGFVAGSRSPSESSEVES
ncbi:VanZ family protein [Halorussus salinus]|uniref:VanZ family protein n=1 Tax=Halorussus salinus TaxID=1364935 RepID=UPI00192FA9B8|nr:VanZ family protein [Halorussus salinus]